MKPTGRRSVGFDDRYLMLRRTKNNDYLSIAAVRTSPDLLDTLAMIAESMEFLVIRYETDDRHRRHASFHCRLIASNAASLSRSDSHRQTDRAGGRAAFRMPGSRYARSAP